jgi:hypothetical protein
MGESAQNYTERAEFVLRKKMKHDSVYLYLEITSEE